MGKKGKSIILISVAFLLLLAIIIAIFVRTRPTKKTGPIPMVCEQCGSGCWVERQDFKKHAMDIIGDGGWHSPPEALAMICSQCGKKAVYPGRECPTCKKLFLPYDGSGGEKERCPECEQGTDEAKGGEAGEL